MSDNIPDKILEAMLHQVPFEGWTDRALQSAVKSLGLPDGSAELYVPGGGASLIGQWSARKDKQMLEQFAAVDKSEMRIRDKVRTAVWMRLCATGPHIEAAKRAKSRLALPDMAGEGLALLWASSDVIWTALGDKSEDYNYYTKRATLSAVLGSSLISYLGDDSEDKAQASAFLDKRIDNVMSFEKFKAKVKGKTSSKTTVGARPSVSDILNVLKGPARLGSGGQGSGSQGFRRRSSWRYHR